MKFEIKSRWNGTVLFSLETTSMKLAVEAAVKRKADLRSANLRSADLRSANLRSADLQSADLQFANLQFANLRSADLQFADLQFADLQFADLQFADLRSANLRSADLRSANLRSADLQSADLQFANLQFANLRSADLQFADLRSADLQLFRDDLWAMLSSAPTEVVGLRTALVDGRIDGSTYDGDCACLIGTLAHVRGCNYDQIPTLSPDSSRPAEIFFATLRPGDTPKKSPNAQLAVDWIDTWLTNMRAAFGGVAS